jgi:hypothetical protein
VQGPLDYRLSSPLSSLNSLSLGVQHGDFDTAVNLVIAALDSGPRIPGDNAPLLGTEDWGSLATACLAAFACGFTRPLSEITRDKYAAYWEEQDNNPQCKLEEGENPEFHSLLQRLKATSQQLDIHINADEVDGLRQWTTTARKEIVEVARRSACADVELALHNWKIDQLTIKQAQLEESLKQTILERNLDLLRKTANDLSLNLGNSAAAPQSRPASLTGNKCTVSGSTPRPPRTAKLTPLPKIADSTPAQTTPLDVVSVGTKGARARGTSRCIGGGG